MLHPLVYCQRMLIMGISVLAFLFPIGLSAGEPLILNDEAPWAVPTINSRLRYEFADQDTLESSHAATFRNRIGLLTRETSGFQFFGEYEGTLVADRNSYRAASVHGPVSKTVIADPESHELNQLWAAYKGEDFSVKAGRQVIKLHGDRFIGDVGWRQNQQTFDAVRFAVSPSEDWEIEYIYLNRANRIFGSEVRFAPQTDFEGNSHLVDTTYKGLPFGDLTGYGYLLDLGNDFGNNESNNTVGLFLEGPLLEKSTYHAEYAYQVDGFDSALNYDANYVHGYLTTPLLEDTRGTIGMEYLESGFRTPLATLHKFNGFADQFLVTPPGGLTDLYASLEKKLFLGINGAGYYHYFWDAELDNAYGQEVDLVLSRELRPGIVALAKGAYFMGEGIQPDIIRADFQLEFNY